jgi:nicotinate-nucleotide adenylyltransferase
MRLGLFGGTFNPIHLGHVVLAESAREQCRLDRVVFMPTATPPHKTSRGLLDGKARLALVRLALRGHAAFRASDFELRQGGVSYTINTVRHMASRYPGATLFLIVGSDLLGVRWAAADELRRLCTMVVAERAGSARPRGGSIAAAGRTRRIVMPSIEISSSMIRERIRRGRSIRYLVPETVAREMARHGWYRRGRQ